MSHHWYKHPNEREAFSFSYSPSLGNAETIASIIEVKVVKQLTRDTEQDYSTEMMAAGTPPAINGENIDFWLQQEQSPGDQPRGWFVVRCIVATSSSRRLTVTKKLYITGATQQQ